MSALIPGGALPPFDVNALSDYRARSIGASFQHVNSLASGLNSLILPAANTAGCILRWIRVNAGSVDMALFADTAAPSGAADTSKRQLCYLTSGTLYVKDDNLFLPAGVGFYAYCTAAGGRLTAGYDLL